MPVVISCFEVPAAADAVIDASPDYAVHRALAADARFRYITIGAAKPLVRLVGAPDGPLVMVSGRYEVCHSREVAAASFAGDEDRPVTFINCMAMEPGTEETAFEVWKQINAYMVTKPGYQWHHLHLRLHADAPFGLINVARWQSSAAWRAAHDAGFRARADRPDLPFLPVPTLCELIEQKTRHDAGLPS